MNHQEKNNNLPIFVAGVIIGALATYLLTNEKGKKIKDRLLEEGTKILDKMREGLEEVEKEMEKAAPAVESIKEHVEEVASEVPKQIEQIQKKGRRFFFRRHSSSES